MVDKDSEEAKIIKQYVKNTHAATHNAYDLKVVEVSMGVLGFKFVQISFIGLFTGLWLHFIFEYLISFPLLKANFDRPISILLNRKT